jgi:hypothetical protein
MKLIVNATIALAASVAFANAQPAKEPYEPGLGEFMIATQLRHAKLWFAGKDSNWDLAAYETDEIKEGLEDAARLHSTDDGVPVSYAGFWVTRRSGGVVCRHLDDLDAVVESDTCNHFRQLICAFEPPPGF